MIGRQRALEAFSGLLLFQREAGGCYGATVHRQAVYDTSVVYSLILLLFSVTRSLETLRR
jgi:hypothetical protein